MKKQISPKWAAVIWLCLLGLTPGLMAAPPCEELKGVNLRAKVRYLQGERTILKKDCVLYAIEEIGSQKFAPAVDLLASYLDYRATPLDRTVSFQIYTTGENYLSVPEHPLHFGPGTSVTSPVVQRPWIRSLLVLHLEICQQSRLWECGNPAGISKECGKGGKPASWLSRLSILCHFHGLLWKRPSHDQNPAKAALSTGTACPDRLDERFGDLSLIDETMPDMLAKSTSLRTEKLTLGEIAPMFEHYKRSVAQRHA